nr:MAG TPA: hypothetical protein [Caudoviricetes sp.]
MIDYRIDKLAFRYVQNCLRRSPSARTRGWQN